MSADFAHTGHSGATIVPSGVVPIINSTQVTDQLVTLGAAEQIDAVRGRMFIWPFDGPIGDAFIQYGEWAENEIGFLSQFISEGDTVIDGGANIGGHTLAFANEVGQTGRVVAIEASAEIAHLLRANVETNSLDRVTVLNVALGSDTEVYVSRVSPGSRFNVGSLQIVRQAAFRNEVQATHLDAIDVGRVSLIKLDLEGCELAALHGAKALLQRTHPAVFCEFNVLDEGIALISFMEEQGFKTYFVAAEAFNPNNYNGSDDNRFGVAREAGLLFLWHGQPVPRQTARVAVHAIQTLADLAQYFFEMPRSGDRTDHDRVPQKLVEERNDGLAEIDRLNRRLDDAASPVESLTQVMHQPTDPAETRRLQSDLFDARRAIADLRQSTMLDQLKFARSVLSDCKLATSAQADTEQPPAVMQVDIVPQPASVQMSIQRRIVRRLRRNLGVIYRHVIRR